MRCVTQCGRKAKPGYRCCQRCLERTIQREIDQGRYRPPRRFRRKDMRESR
jgi:hypothetical protein